MTFNEYLEEKKYHVPYTEKDLLDMYEFGKNEIIDILKNNVSSMSDGYKLQEVVCLTKLKTLGILDVD